MIIVTKLLNFKISATKQSTKSLLFVRSNPLFYKLFSSLILDTSLGPRPPGSWYQIAVSCCATSTVVTCENWCHTRRDGMWCYTRRDKKWCTRDETGCYLLRYSSKLLLVIQEPRLVNKFGYIRDADTWPGPSQLVSGPLMRGSPYEVWTTRWNQVKSRDCSLLHYDWTTASTMLSQQPHLDLSSPYFLDVPISPSCFSSSYADFETSCAQLNSPESDRVSIPPQIRDQVLLGHLDHVLSFHSQLIRNLERR